MVDSNTPSKNITKNKADERASRLNVGSQTPDRETLGNVERAHILRVLDQTNWVIAGKEGAASILGLNPNTLRSRMQKLGIQKPRPAL